MNTFVPETNLLNGRHEAQEIAHLLTAAYWSHSKYGHREFLVREVHKEFAKLAAVLGYRIEKIEAPVEAQTEAA